MVILIYKIVNMQLLFIFCQLIGALFRSNHGPPSSFAAEQAAMHAALSPSMSKTMGTPLSAPDFHFAMADFA